MRELTKHTAAELVQIHLHIILFLTNNSFDLISKNWFAQQTRNKTRKSKNPT